MASRAEDQAAINQTGWNSPSNWRWGVYRSRRDTRVWVSKQRKWAGWTLNFAHRAAWAWLAALLLPALLSPIVYLVATVNR
ncbi:hypothetical protein Pla175_44010 [Pirellulimonas nuda]|uniref:Uncharacterized protein n=1 Tax=Pirellulimonas nuda TaxID=2528009 RepID=A0A518DHP3_9BACT|nr:DUF5808 domain-containing protein [Pirellulimonas nuda]QDU90986.1 hypothetical protein Pla175_44010 [Pirellulimonas nuda]